MILFLSFLKKSIAARRAWTHSSNDGTEQKTSLYLRWTGVIIDMIYHRSRHDPPPDTNLRRLNMTHRHTRHNQLSEALREAKGL